MAGGDFGGIPFRNYAARYPTFEGGITWATQYSSELSGVLALGQSMYLVSNFQTRDILGKTAGICVNPWDFNFVKANAWFDGTLVYPRPQNYSRTQYQECDCSYHKCDREFQGLGFTLDFNALWQGENGLTGLGFVFNQLYGDAISDGSLATQRLNNLGFPKELLDPNNNGNYLERFGGGNAIRGEISPIQLADYQQGLNLLDLPTIGKDETNLLGFALINITNSITGGIAFKDAIVSTFSLTKGIIGVVTGQSWSDLDDGNYDGVALVDRLLTEKVNDIPGFSAKLLYRDVAGLENIAQKCMCLDAGMHGYDAYDFADFEIASNQLRIQAGQDGTEVGGRTKFFEYFGLDPGNITPQSLAKFLTIDGERLIAMGVTGAKPYKYGPNWMFGGGFSELNVVSLATPKFKNWEVRDSGKIRMSGNPNGEVYSFGNQWLEWGQRIGSPEIQAVAKNSITIEGGDFVDPNFGYKGNLEGSLIYKGRLPEEVLSYEAQDYEYAFSGFTSGNIGSGNKKFIFGLTTIRHIDAVNNIEAYGVTGDIETIVFSEGFSESPQDKTIYRL
jgi:hypothetical protein